MIWAMLAEVLMMSIADTVFMALVISKMSVSDVWEFGRGFKDFVDFGYECS